jgi:hypothetical protein
MRRILVTGAGGLAAANFVHSLRLASEPFYVVGTDTSKFHLELAPVDERYLLHDYDGVSQYAPRAAITAGIVRARIEMSSQIDQFSR